MDHVVVCPQCGKAFAAKKEHHLVEVHGRRAARRKEELRRRATNRLRELERAERAGELAALRGLLAERRATITRLREEERALRKRARELEVR